MCYKGLKVITLSANNVVPVRLGLSALWLKVREGERLTTSLSLDLFLSYETQSHVKTIQFLRKNIDFEVVI